MSQAKKPYDYICPICGHQRDGKDRHCPSCGWVYDEDCKSEQEISARNYVTPNQYKDIFVSLKKEHRGYSYIEDPYLMNEAKLDFMRKNGMRHPLDGHRYEKPCPVCGEKIIHFEYDICPVCGWLVDPIQSEDPDNEDGPNRSTVNQAKEAFHKLREKDPDYRWDNDPENLGKKLKEITGQFD